MPGSWSWERNQPEPGDMRAFRFRLQKVLDLRKAREKEALVQVARALRRLESEVEALQSLQCQRACAWRELHDGIAGARDGGPEREVLLRHIGDLDAGIAGTEERLRQVEEELAQARTGADERRRDSAAMEKLRERGQLEYHLEERRLESREMDEVAVMRHARTRRPGESI